jgi:hypothetical protein
MRLVSTRDDGYWVFFDDLTSDAWLGRFRMSANKAWRKGSVPFSGNAGHIQWVGWESSGAVTNISDILVIHEHIERLLLDHED